VRPRTYAVDVCAPRPRSSGKGRADESRYHPDSRRSAPLAGARNPTNQDIGTRPGLVRAAGRLQRILWTYRAASTSRSASSQSSSSSPGVKPRRSAIQYAAVAIRDSRSSAVRGCLVSSSRSMALLVVAGRCGNAVPLEAGPDEVTAPEFLESAIVFSCVQAMDAAAPDGCGSES
jgi:hypothetical protein